MSDAVSAENAPLSGARRLSRAVTPLALFIVAVISVAVAVQSEKAPSPPRAIGARSPVTPVLSARRVPDIIAAPVADRRLVTKLTDLASRTPGASCLTVHAGGREIFASNPTLPLSPASIEKLLTADAALGVLGADTTLHTSVRIQGDVTGGVVDGNLTLVGGGDPLLMTDAYAQSFRHPPTERTSIESLADRIVAAGVREVRGSVVGDDSRYDGVRYLSVWPTRFVTAADIGPMSALTVDDGFEQFPPAPDLRVPKVMAAADPAALAATRLTEALTARGVTVQGPAASGRAPRLSRCFRRLPLDFHRICHMLYRKEGIQMRIDSNAAPLQKLPDLPPAQAREVAGEREHDGDSDDMVRTAAPAARAVKPEGVGNKVDLLA